MKIKVLKIPFSTKPKSKYKILGEAFYLINEDLDIVKQFIQISEATYRPTDEKMLKKDYYKENSLKIKIREKYLKNITSSKENYKVFSLPSSQIKSINIDLLQMSQVKSSIDIFVGSNSPGAECSPSKTNIIYNDKSNQSLWCNGINFSNPLNKLLIKKYKTISKKYNHITMDEINKNEIILIDEICENPKYLKIENILKQYNSLAFFEKSNPNLSSKSIKNELYLSLAKDIEEEIKILKYKKGEKEYYIESIKSVISQFQNGNVTIDFCEKRLRNIQKALLSKEIHELNTKYNDLSINFVEEDHCANRTFEYAHIISVKFSKESNDLGIIADPNNCLILSPNIHTMFDKSIITFDENGNVIQNDDKKISHIKEKYLTEERKKYIEENYRYFLKHHRNK